MYAVVSRLTLFTCRLTCQSSEGEHANLLKDMVPSSWCTIRLQSLEQLSSHGTNAIRHCHQVIQPEGVGEGVGRSKGERKGMGRGEGAEEGREGERRKRGVE